MKKVETKKFFFKKKSYLKLFKKKSLIKLFKYFYIFGTNGKVLYLNIFIYLNNH